jgi:hypothetical protein
MTDDRPAWARRIRTEREVRGWSQSEAVRALRAHATRELPSHDSLVRRWKSWEAGEHEPDNFYKPLIARTFGTVTDAFFPRRGSRHGDAEILAVSGMDTLDIISRLRQSDVNNATLDALRITVDRLCSEYPHLSATQLADEGRQWLRRIAELQSHRLTLGQHRDILELAGRLALLVGCVEYDMGDRAAAEATRRAALDLGAEADSAEIRGWAHEMTAWFALTAGNYPGVVLAARAGTEIAGQHGVAVQLAAQEAKAWARMGDRRHVELALERGRVLLEQLAHPTNLDNHFVVDPAKYDFYAMDCYRIVGEDALAESYANEVIRAGTDHVGNERAPMRIAEARVTLGVVAARSGDSGGAVELGERALAGDRKSLPSLLMVSAELSALLERHHSAAAEVRDYLDHLRALATTARQHQQRQG